MLLTLLMKTLKKYLKYIVYFILILLMGYTYNLYRNSQELKSIVLNKGIENKALVVKWVDSNNKSRARVKVVEANKETAKIAYGKELAALEVEIKGLKIRNLRSSGSVQTVTEGRVEVQLVRDTIFVTGDPDTRHFTFEDPYLYLEGELSTIADRMSLTYRITNSIKLVEYRKKSGFLGIKKEVVVEAISENPNTTITGLTSLKINPTRKRVGLVLYAGLGMNSKGFSPQIGIGVGYRIF